MLTNMMYGMTEALMPKRRANGDESLSCGLGDRVLIIGIVTSDDSAFILKIMDKKTKLIIYFL